VTTTVTAPAGMVALALVLIVSACGGAGTVTGTRPPGTGTRTSSSPQGRIVAPAREFGDACRLLSAAEVQAAAGDGSLTATPRSDPQLGSFCVYTRQSTSETVLTVQVAVQASAEDARGAVAQLGGSPLSGIGDAARVSSVDGLGTAVHVARGSTLATLSTGQALPRQVIVQLASLLARRL
jgi:hypothetical protein